MKNPHNCKAAKAAIRFLVLLLSAFFILKCTGPGPKEEVVDLSPDTPIQIEQGLITGLPSPYNPGIISYKGIPYAAPPVGELRWKEPQPTLSWEGVKAMESYGNSSLTPVEKNEEGEMVEKNELKSEDCLFLNIWTPAKKSNEKLPVMVWIHGGGFKGGSGNLPKGSALAGRDIVLVSVNYRLGPMGFFAHPLLSAESGKGISGNYGILDMICALEWVQKNISRFGGDADNVTIFGESAGGTAVYILSSSDLTKDLFHKAIAQSPWVTDASISPLKNPAFSRESVETTGIRMAEMLCDSGEVTLEKLREMNAVELVNRSGEKFRLPAAVDGYVMKENPAILFERGLQQSRPFIAGSNTDEGTMFLWGADKMTVEEYHLEVQESYKEYAGNILELYPVNEKGEVKGAVNQSINDTWFAQPTRWMAKHMSKVNENTYLYHFAHTCTWWPEGGSCHAAEIVFVFNDLKPEDRTESYNYLSDAMITYWTNFAKTGNPNGERVPYWPRYKEESDQNIRLDTAITVESNYLKENLDGLDAFYSDIRDFK